MLILLTTGMATVGLLLLTNMPLAQQPKGCPNPGICDPLQFDEYHKLSWTDEKVRLNNAATHLRQADGDVLYIVAYGGREACVGEAIARNRRAKRYLVRTRGLSAEHVVTVDGGYRNEATVEIWFGPPTPGWAFANPTLDKREVHLKQCR